MQHDLQLYDSYIANMLERRAIGLYQHSNTLPLFSFFNVSHKLNNWQLVFWFFPRRWQFGWVTIRITCTNYYSIWILSLILDYWMIDGEIESGCCSAFDLDCIGPVTIVHDIVELDCIISPPTVTYWLLEYVQHIPMASIPLLSSAEVEIVTHDGVYRCKKSH